MNRIKRTSKFAARGCVEHHVRWHLSESAQLLFVVLSEQAGRLTTIIP